MKVIAKQNFVVNGKIYERGCTYDVGDVPFEVWRQHGWIEPVNVIDDAPEVPTESAGLPPLDDTPPARKRK